MSDKQRMGRLYAGMNPRESATLAFRHLAEGNACEAHRISDAVPWKSYRMRDFEHTDWFERLRRLTLFYGLERWRFEARCHAAVAVVLHCYDCADSEDERGSECFEAWQKWETHLLSLDAALDAACCKHNIDVTAVRRLVSIEGPYKVQGLGEVDPLLLADMTQNFDNALRQAR
jgi:hypothetical protein